MTCSWTVDRSSFPALPHVDDPTYAAKLAVQNSAEDVAIMVIWSLSARRFGQCEVVARPCPPAPQLPFHTYYTGDPVSPFIPVFEAGAWRNMHCGCHSRCQTSGPSMVHLPGPAGKIVSVTIGADILDAAEYVLEGDVLYRRGGKSWPTQNYTLPTGEPGTWSVRYTRGEPVPAGVPILVGMLAKEFINACLGSNCRLPRTVVSTTRTGVTHSFDPSRIYAAGKTGLPEVDQWLAAVNPNRLMQGPKVL